MMNSIATFLKWAFAVIVTAIAVFVVYRIYLFITGIIAGVGKLPEKAVTKLSDKLGETGSSPWYLENIRTWFKYSK